MDSEIEGPEAAAVKQAEHEVFESQLGPICAHHRVVDIRDHSDFAPDPRIRCIVDDEPRIRRDDFLRTDQRLKALHHAVEDRSPRVAFIILPG